MDNEDRIKALAGAIDSLDDVPIAYGLHKHIKEIRDWIHTEYGF